jgi:long-chain fatty acid transport protein
MESEGETGMRLLGISLGVVGIIAVGVAPTMAGGIDNRTNWSAEYIRTLNRNAATDSADIAAYNPAGIMKMDNGAYVNLSAQSVGKTYTNNVNGTDLESDEPSFVPGLFGIYKKDKWGAYGAVTVVCGGGKVKFKNGNATTQIGGWSLINMINAGAGAILYDTIKNEYNKAESYYIGYTVGGAYAINDMISVSLGARYVDAEKELQATLQVQPSALGAGLGQTDRTAVLNVEDTATGWGGIIGVDIAPTENLLIGLRYETSTHLKFKYKVKQDTVTGLPSGLGAAQGYINGVKHRRDLPALLGLGVSHQCTPKLRAEADLTYYFDEKADWGGAENNVGNGYDVGLALEYIFNDRIKGSVGYMYTDVDQPAQYKLPENPALGASTVGAGIVYTPKPAFDLNLSVGKVFYENASYTDVSSGTPLLIEYKKDIIFLAFGIQYKFDL